MGKRISVLFLVLLLLPGLCLGVKASGRLGSIQVTVRSGGKPVSGSTVTLFRVGAPMEGGYRIVDAFGGGMVHQEDALSPQLAQWLAQQEGEPGMVRILDADGAAVFSRLEEGLYLLIQNHTPEDVFPIIPFLMVLPYEGQWDVEAHPYTQQVFTDLPRTGQHPGPFIGAAGMVASGIGLALCVGRRRRK